MPMLFYGTLGPSPRRVLYAEGLRPITASLFDHLKIENLAPWSGKRYIANYWWIRLNRRHIHSCFAWHDDRKIEQSVFIPGELQWRDALCLAREHFPTVMPSSIVFRLNNYDSVYLYD